MTNLVSYPSSVLLGEFFNIEVDSAPIGWSYGVYDYTTGSSLASGIVEATAFTIVCSGLSEPVGAHSIELFLFLDINNIQSIPFEISATDSAFSVSVNPTYNGALFRSLVVFWYDIATSNSTVTIDSAAPRTFILDNVYLSPSVGIEPGDFIRVRSATGSPGSFGGGQGEANVVSYNATTQELVVTFSGWNVTTASSWYISFGQPKYLLGEDVYDIFPVTVTGATSGLTYSQVDLGNGLLPNWLTLNSSTGEITGKVPSFPIPEVQGPGAMMAPYQVGISVTDGISTQVVSWTFGGVTGFYAAGITDPISRSALYSIPVGFLYPEGTVELISYNLTTGAVTNNGYTTLSAGDGVTAAGSGSLSFATPTPGKYAFNGKLMAFEGSSYTVDVWFGGSVSPVSGISSGGVTVFEGVPPALTTVTNTATYRINETISPLTIATGSGGSYPLIYRVSGYLLPEGLEVNTSTGVITGTPTTFGDPNRDPNQPFAHVLIATDGVRDSNPVYFNINIVGPLSTNTVIPNSTVIVGVPVSLRPVTVSNAVGATTWSITPSVPGGLSFNTANGQIFGTASGTSPSTTYSVTVQDSEGQLSTSTFTLVVETSNLATTLAVPSITLSINVGMTASTPVTYTGGYGAITYSVSPSLPAGLIFNTSNGTITGAPTAVQSSTPYTITVRDEAGQSSGQTFSLTVLDQLSAVVLTPLLEFPRNETIEPVNPITGIGGVLPYTYSISPTLPSGLSFAGATGVISGTPNASSTATSYTVTISDSNAKSVSASFILRVQPLVISANTLTIVRASDFNDIKTLTEEILGTNILGYGYQGVKSVNTNSVGQLIGWKEWSNLKDDVNLCTLHLTGNEFAYTTGTARTITSQFVSQLIDNLNTIESNRYNRPTQVATGTTSSVWTSTYVSTWGSQIQTTATLSWAEGFDINYYFNLGGTIEFDLDYLPSNTSTNNLGWQSFINSEQVQTFLNNFRYDRNSYLGFATVSTSTTSTTGSVVLSVTKNLNTLTCTLRLTNNQTGTTDLRAIGMVNYVYANTAILSPLPRRIDLAEFSTGTFLPVITPVKALQLTATGNTYSWNIGSSSTSRTITLTNTGNQPVSVSGVTFNDNSNVTRIVNGVTGGSVGAFIVSTTSNYTFNLAYTGTVQGSFNSSFTVNAESPVGNLTTSTNQIVGAQPFAITVTPTSVTTSSLGLGTWRQDFVISATNGDSFTYASTLVSPNAPPGSVGWSRSDTQAAGPTLSFSPAGSTTSTYTATVSLSITATSPLGSTATVVVPVSITLNLPTSYNLGSWVSPLATDNAVIGMSYDLIAGERYLTIGVGMGADGSVPLNVGGSSSVNVNNLGINADIDFKQGQRLFPVTSQASDWSPFLKALGVWPNATPEQPVNINVAITPTYRFYAPVNGNYTYEFSVDDDGDFYLFPADQYGNNNGSRISLSPSLLTGGSNSNWRQSYTGDVYLTAGWYIFRYYHINFARKTAAAFQIKDPSGNILWNTRNPVRNYSPYLYWQDVMRIRIPADGTARDLYSSFWYVKNTYQVSNKAHWGYYFNPDMFKVSDDGIGNLNIEIFGTPRAPITTDPNASSDKLTIKMLSAAFYYYLPTSLVQGSRISNLDAGPVGDGTQTRFFTGFDASGNVRTILRSIPRTIAEPTPTTTGGGGGGGGGTPFDPDTGEIRVS